jgi:hypothetical protein
VLTCFILYHLQKFIFQLMLLLKLIPLMLSTVSMSMRKGHLRKMNQWKICSREKTTNLKVMIVISLEDKILGLTMRRKKRKRKKEKEKEKKERKKMKENQES